MISSESLTVQMCGLKAKSKKEMYKLLVIDGKLYLSPTHLANHQYIRDILTIKKLVSLHKVLYASSTSPQIN